MEKKYQIGGTTYIQRPLVLGQMKQIREVIGGMVIPATFTPAEIIQLLEDRLPLALAVVLTPEGFSPKGKDLVAIAEQIDFAIELETAMEVVEDFFICNPVVSLSKKLAGITDALLGMMKPTGLTRSSSSLPTETLPGETS